ncbi:phosphate-starvation-inducible PsiE family protein [Halorussus sp. AFM4]|uniref:phosphate-starvation-inducible PsiE family protein n=1 Tax=Halorussus sp. AFM4 TaxID=3421651 RepID=UPI003EC03635
MSEDADDANADGRVPDVEVSWSRFTETYVVVLERFIRGVEVATATVFAALFAIGVADLLLQIVQSARTGRITDPLVVIGFIDTGLLLLIIVEVYQTVLAYVQESETRSIVRLIIYTGVIAMVRKAIIFRTGEYQTTQDALFAAVAYTIIIFGLVALLLTERVYGETRLIESE